jgi:glutaredoxin
MNKIIILSLIAFGAYQLYSNNSDMSASYGEPHDELIMYSLTTCGYCKQKVKELKRENIVFKEYYIDKDIKKMEELNSKLTKAGFKPKSYGTPIFDAHGVMLPNNPEMSLIKSTLQSI